MSEEKITIKGRKIELPEGRSVAVGMVDGEDEIYLMFVNQEGINTDLKLSPEAAQALEMLLPLFVSDGWRRKITSA